MAIGRLTIDSAQGVPFLRNLIGRFNRRYRDAVQDATATGSREGLADVMDEWKRLSTDLAPLEFGTLQRGIKTKITREGDEVSGGITASAIERHRGGHFDYAVYLHDDFPEKHGDEFANPTTSGTIPRFIDVPAEKNGRKWSRMIEQSIKAELRRRGI